MKTDIDEEEFLVEENFDDPLPFFVWALLILIPLLAVLGHSHWIGWIVWVISLACTLIHAVDYIQSRREEDY